MDYGTIPQEQYYIPKKHSRMGIASFIIALAQGFITLLVIIFAGILAATARQYDNEAAFAFVGLFIILGMIAHLVGAVLGIAGAIQSSRKKVFAIIGLILNIAVLLFIIVLIVIGSIVEQ
ncbi:MAG: hypothetical protein JW715_02490 [Sedimentisphaerales bacterium]|nr:hypothetical protein [Sedimentisphaerales bacterium]